MLPGCLLNAVVALWGTTCFWRVGVALVLWWGTTQEAETRTRKALADVGCVGYGLRACALLLAVLRQRCGLLGPLEELLVFVAPSLAGGPSHPES